MGFLTKFSSGISGLMRTECEPGAGGSRMGEEAFGKMEPVWTLVFKFKIVRALLHVQSSLSFPRAFPSIHPGNPQDNHVELQAETTISFHS